jgi:radical SAM protein with 4Fe4S-binding SPASM domain
MSIPFTHQLNAMISYIYCKNCNLLPACMGPCSQKMVEFSPDKDFRTICQQDGVRLVLEEQVDNFYKNFQKK